MIKQNNKFTLIELMVVVAIIGILLSFLLPMLGKARATARQAVCASNLKQMYYGALLYSENNKGYYPATNYADSWFTFRSTHDFIAPYVMDVKTESGHYPALLQSQEEGGIFNCPSFDDSEPLARGMNSWDPIAYYSLYTANPYIVNASYPFLDIKRGKPRKVSRLPSEMILHTEGGSQGTSELYFDRKQGLYQYHGDKNISN